MLAAQAFLQWPWFESAAEHNFGRYAVTVPGPAQSRQGVAHYQLRLAPGVTFGIIKKIDSCIISQAHAFNRCAHVYRTAEGHPGAITESAEL